MESEICKPTVTERAGNKDHSTKSENLDLNPITLWDHFDSEEDINGKEDEKENKDINGMEKINLPQKATKPEEPLEPDIDVAEDWKSNASSNSGFPVFGAESDDEGDERKERAENLLKIFGGHD